LAVKKVTVLLLNKNTHFPCPRESFPCALCEENHRWRWCAAAAPSEKLHTPATQHRFSNTIFTHATNDQLNITHFPQHIIDFRIFFLLRALSFASCLFYAVITVFFAVLKLNMLTFVSPALMKILLLF